MSSGKEKPCLPHGWEVHQSTTYPERVYYYNVNTHVSSWNCPQLISPADSSQAPSQVPLPTLLSDRSLVFPKENSARAKQDKIVVSPKPPSLAFIKVTSPPSKVNATSPPVSFKATSPPCVSSTSEVNVEREVKITSISSDASKLIPQSPPSMPARRKLVRPSLNDTAQESTKNNIRFNPYNSAKRNAAIVAPVKTQQSKPLSPNKKTKQNIISLKSINYVTTSEQKDLKCTPAPVRNDRKRSQPSTTTPPVYATVVRSPFPEAETASSGQPAQNSTGKRKKKKAVSRNKSFSPVATPGTNEKKTQDTGKIHNKIDQVRISPLLIGFPVNDFATPKHYSGNTVPDFSDDVEMLDVSDDYVGSSSSKEYFIVVDTNVLMSNLKFVDELKDSPLEGCGPPTVIVPWIVLEELDHLKNGHNRESEKVQKSNDAVRYIYDMFSAKHPRICGQSSLENAQELEGSLKSSCNDDRILQCCLQMSKKVPSEKVILLTNDKNLCNKATVHQIRAFTCDTFYQHLKVDFTDVSKAPAYAMSCNISVSTELSKGVENLRLEVDKVMIQAKSALKNCLGEFLQKEMHSAYKGDMWLKVVHLKPPWSLLDILDCLNKHWIAVFTFVLGKKMKNHIEKMHSALKSTKGYIFDEEQALGLVSSGISLCTNIASRGSKTAKDTLDKLNLLHKQLLCLGKNNTPAKSNSESSSGSDSQNNASSSAVSVIPRKSSENLVIEYDPFKEVNTKVKMVFQHVWFILNHLCGTVLDSLGWPHKLDYNKPPTLPPKEETEKFIPLLYPELQKLRKHMMSVVPAKDVSDEKFCQNVRDFYKQVLSILPSLNVNECAPVSITEEEFKEFCTNLDNKEILQGGLKQLLQFFALIHKSIIGTASVK